MELLRIIFRDLETITSTRYDLKSFEKYNCLNRYDTQFKIQGYPTDLPRRENEVHMGERLTASFQT